MKEGRVLGCAMRLPILTLQGAQRDEFPTITE